MRQFTIGLHRSRHLFSARTFHAPSPAFLRRRLRRWLAQASDGAIGARVIDNRFNPFFFVV